MIAKKKYVIAFTVFMLTTTLAMVSVPVKPQSPTTFYVDQPEGGIPGKPVGTVFSIDLLVYASELEFLSPEGIVGWGLRIQVDPTVLKLDRIITSIPGYFLWEFMDAVGGGYPSIVSGEIEPGLLEISEQILPTPPGGAATDDPYDLLPAPQKLVSIQYESLSQLDSTPIDIIAPVYMDANGNWFDVVDGDGDYVGLVTPTVEATLANRKAWVEHHHFDLSKDEDGRQTLYAKILNTGEETVTTRAVFRLMKSGAVEPANVTDEIIIDPGDKAVVEVNSRMFGEEADAGGWVVIASLEYYNPYALVWQTSELTKTLKFTIVP